MSPKKRAELNLKGSAHSCEKDLAVVSGSYFNTNTGLFRGAEGGSRPWQTPGEAAAPVREKNQEKTRLVLARCGMASLGPCFDSKQHKMVIVSNMQRELRGPGLVLLHISRSTRKKKKGELTHFADPS